MSHMHEELEVGQHLDQALRSSVTGIAQLMERIHRRDAERDRAVAVQKRDQAQQAGQQYREAQATERDQRRRAETAARDQVYADKRAMLDERDASRLAYGPWLREGAVERSGRLEASRAWARAAGWVEQDPRARDAEKMLRERITDAYGVSPSVILRSVEPGHGNPTGIPAGRISLSEAHDLATKYAPHYYGAHTSDSFGRIGKPPINPIQERFVDDWQRWAATGSLPHDTLVHEWARHSGHSDLLDSARFAAAAEQEAALEKVWRDDTLTREGQEYEHHKQQLADAGMATAAADEAAGVSVQDRPDYRPYLNPDVFANTDARVAVQAWESATRDMITNPGDRVAATAREHLEEQFRRRHHVSPATYLADAVHDMQVTQTDARREAAHLQEIGGRSAQPTPQVRSAEDAPEMASASSLNPQLDEIPLLSGQVLLEVAERASNDEEPLAEGVHSHVLKAADPTDGGGSVEVTVTDDDELIVQPLHAELYLANGISVAQAAEILGLDEAQTREAVREAGNTIRSELTWPRRTNGEPDQPLRGRVVDTSGDADVAPLAAERNKTRQTISDMPLTTAEVRGVAPTKAPTPQERDHRSRTWQIAERDFRAGLDSALPPAQAGQAWRDLPEKERYERYWAAYDTDEAHGISAAATPEQSVTESRPNAQTHSVSAAPVSRERVLELNEAAAQWYSDNLRPGTPGHEYLTGRLGANALTNGQWRLGYAPGEWNGLARHLRRETSATDQEIVDAGLGRISSRGNVIDAFRNRAMAAITDTDGSVVGFYGRDLTGEDRNPKHLNTGATPAYAKGEHVFGLHEATPGGRIARAEATFDAIAITEASDGQLQGVAPLGTALTDVQADKIAGKVGSDGRIWLALDSDAAGQRQVAKDFWKFTERGIDVRELGFPAGADPAQMWQEQPDVMRGLVAYPDVARSASMVVMDATIAEERVGLLTGDQAARERVDLAEGELASVLRNEFDRGDLNAHVHSELDRLRAQEAQALQQAEHLDQREGQLRDRALQSLDPNQREQLEGRAERLEDAEQVQRGRAAQLHGQEVAAQGHTADVDDAADMPYNRAASSDLSQVSPGAARARAVSAHGFSQSTQEALETGRTAGKQWQPKRTTGTQQQIGRSRGMRR